MQAVYQWGTIIFHKLPKLTDSAVPYPHPCNFLHRVCRLFHASFTLIGGSRRGPSSQWRTKDFKLEGHYFLLPFPFSFLFSSLLLPSHTFPSIPTYPYKSSGNEEEDDKTLCVHNEVGCVAAHLLRGAFRQRGLNSIQPAYDRHRSDGRFT